VFHRALILAPPSLLPILKTPPVFSAHDHLFADDTQSYDHCSVTMFKTSSSASKIALRTSLDLTTLLSHRLQLNYPSKSEFVWFGSRSALSKIPAKYHKLTIYLRRPCPVLQVCSWSRVASCDITRPTANQRLQLCSRQHYNVHNRTSTARSEYRNIVLGLGSTSRQLWINFTGYLFSAVLPA